jgi:hypothetical protein
VVSHGPHYGVVSADSPIVEPPDLWEKLTVSTANGAFITANFPSTSDDFPLTPFAGSP